MMYFFYRFLFPHFSGPLGPGSISPRLINWSVDTPRSTLSNSRQVHARDSVHLLLIELCSVLCVPKLI